MLNWNFATYNKLGRTVNPDPRHEADVAKMRKRVRRDGVLALLLWLLNMALTFLGAPFWVIALNGCIASFLVLRNRRFMRSEAIKTIMPSHPDPDVQALIDREINIEEYRRRKEEASPNNAFDTDAAGAGQHKR